MHAATLLKTLGDEDEDNVLGNLFHTLCDLLDVSTWCVEDLAQTFDVADDDVSFFFVTEVHHDDESDG
ncbi:hypothetical protein N7509_012428 [Penicillium cosmopolitanum]|uniref:Uncharacterized protein n=1 Tax=Penicillium cosmopolitanum TaxID=1131564 RepID=A0A9W9SL85_9EURO|nr:uncharacterized protein N7509_012428 [Penicillium cosmopolitanum]KAJ5379309.1 hypothetical protein N7509_012428 [Penicillium cosmopolitanum]